MTKIKKEKIRVRMAPSPTGWLHIGTARTALFNWLFAKHQTGEFIVRIEDTDKERSTKEFEKDILDGFEWLGLKWDELYHQSERAKYYSKNIQKLLDEGKAFWCYHTEEELEKERQEQLKGKELPRHVCEYKVKGQMSNVESGEKGIIRLAVDENSTRKIGFEDIIRGKIEFEEGLLGDFSIAKNVNEILYNFAVVVDDHMMEISHVIRGEDHIANTPKQLLLYKAFGWTPPKFVHLPLILGEDRSKMSKRDGIVRVDDYRKAGYLPGALINFLALLGWTPKGDREMLTTNEIIEQFALEDIHKSSAVFDIKKLNWINSQYIRLENDEGIRRMTEPFVEKFFGPQEEEKIIKMAPIFRERLEYLDQVGEYHYFFEKPEYEPGLLVWKKSDAQGAKTALSTVLEKLKNINGRDKDKMRKELDLIAEEKFGGDRGAVYWPLRVALSGEKYSADPIEIMSILMPDEVFSRVKDAISAL